MNKDYIQTYDDEVRCQFWWDAFKIVVPPVFEEESNQPTQFGTATLEYREAEVLAEREECAKVCEQGTGGAVQTATLEILLRERKRIAKAIRTRGAK